MKKSCDALCIKGSVVIGQVYPDSTKCYRPFKSHKSQSSIMVLSGLMLFTVSQSGGARQKKGTIID